MSTRASRSLRRRTVVALAVVLAVLAAFVIRLVDIQVVNADQHTQDAREVANMEIARTVYGTRGEITDSEGNVLATSTIRYDVQVDPFLAGKGVEVRDDEGELVYDDAGDPVVRPWSEIAAEIAEITEQDPAEVQAVVDDALAADDQARYGIIKKYVSTEEFRELEALGYSFLTFPEHPSRIYPNGAVAGNILGFVGSDGNPLEGVEAQQESCLAQTDGEVVYQRGADGVVIPGTEQKTAAADGGTLQLTIDSDLQWYLQQMMAEETKRVGAEWGGVLVVEVDTGKIRAAAEAPTVDPNAPGTSLAEDRGSRLFRYQYEPGSTFKAVTAALAVEEGGLTPTSSVTVPDQMDFPNGASISDSEPHPTEQMTLTGGLVNSSNVAMSQFGTENVSAQDRYDFLVKVGVGQGTALDWAGEPDGVIHPADQWDAQTYYTTTFGQAFTTTVPQVASVYQMFANGGLQMPLSIVESCTLADGTVVEPELPEPEQVISEETADQVSLMLENVFAQGTMAEDIAIEGYRMAGKTGTAQVSDGEGGYKKNLYFTSMIGYAPAEDPEYVVISVFNEPKSPRMSSANRESLRMAMTQVLTHYRVMPSESETPILPMTE